MPFLNLEDAGRRLGQALLPMRGEAVVVLGLQRRGLGVAEQVALALGAPLDVMLIGDLAQRAGLFRSGRPALSLAGRTAIVVDDGIDSGSTARTACLRVRTSGAARVVLAVPVAAPSSIWRLRPVADEVVCLEEPPDFGSVAQYYDDFSQPGDDEVVAALTAAKQRTRT